MRTVLALLCVFALSCGASQRASDIINASSVRLLIKELDAASLSARSTNNATALLYVITARSHLIAHLEDTTELRVDDFRTAVSCALAAYSALDQPLTKALAALAASIGAGEPLCK